MRASSIAARIPPVTYARRLPVEAVGGDGSGVDAVQLRLEAVRLLRSVAVEPSALTPMPWLR